MAPKTDEPATPELALDDIQGIILRGYGHLDAACFLLLRIDDGQHAAQWLAKLKLTSAAVAAQKQAAAGPFVNVAFSHHGLQRLGVHGTLLKRFPREFIEGSDTPERTRALGDTGSSAAKHWRWGNRERVVDMVLLLYAGSEAELAPVRQHYLAQAAAAGMTLVVPPLGTAKLAGRKEHFGFRDGIAQPVIAGSRDVPAGPDTLAPGEILLGHRNGYGRRARVPFAQGVQLGHNGCYMVMRQLAQDVPGFWRYCQEQSGSGGAAADAVSLASKMVGRWPSGAPLVDHPDKDPGAAYESENNFGYAASDPLGHRCPLGAHIRRAQPRDWLLGVDAAHSRQLSNRHRIVRRGRAYGAPYDEDMSPASVLQKIAGHDPAREGIDGGDAERGLHFICFNADIERQFEFIQQHWCNSYKFAGLDSGPDPLLGGAEHAPGCDKEADYNRDPHAPTFTVPGVPLRRRAVHLPRFVRVVGSGYFFMPSIGDVAAITGGVCGTALVASGANLVDNSPPTRDTFAGRGKDYR